MEGDVLFQSSSFLQARQLQSHLTLLLGSFHTSDLQPESEAAEPGQQWLGGPGGHAVLWSAKTTGLPPKMSEVSGFHREASGRAQSPKGNWSVTKIPSDSSALRVRLGMGQVLQSFKNRVDELHSSSSGHLDYSRFSWVWKGSSFVFLKETLISTKVAKWNYVSIQGLILCWTRSGSSL